MHASSPTNSSTGQAPARLPVFFTVVDTVSVSLAVKGSTSPSGWEALGVSGALCPACASHVAEPVDTCRPEWLKVV